MNNHWDKLSIALKNYLMGLYVKNGITRLDTIKDTYNSFKDGGSLKPPFEDYYKGVPAEKADTTSFNLRRAYELLPYEEMLLFAKDDNYHLRSIAPRPGGDYKFLKSKFHPTYKLEVDWYNSPDGAEFKSQYELDDTNEYPIYKRIKK